MKSEKSSKCMFYEEQCFRLPWVMLVVFGIAVLQWYAAIQQLIFKLPFGQNPMSDLAAFIYWIAFGIGFPLLFIFTRLTTDVCPDGVYFRFSPFHQSTRTILFSEVAHCEQYTFNALFRYGGWGLRWQYKGMAYLVSGNRGVQFELKDGKRILIGSQRIDNFWQAIPERVKMCEASTK